MGMQTPWWAYGASYGRSALVLELQIDRKRRTWEGTAAVEARSGGRVTKPGIQASMRTDLAVLD